MSQKKRKLMRRAGDEIVGGKTEVLTIQKGIWQILVENWKILAIVFLGIILVNFNNLAANFVSDDYAAITQNQTIGDPVFMLGSLNSTSFSTFAVAGLFGVGSPIPFHIFNLGLLLIITAITFVVVYKMFGFNVALITTGIFALHPIHVEAVTWISGRPYLFIALYVLLAFLCLIRFRETGRKMFVFMAIFSFLAGFFTDNPRPFSLFPIMFLYLATVGFKGFEKVVKFIPLILVVLGIVLIIAWPHIIQRINIVNAGYNSSESIFYNPFFQYPTGLAKYFQLLWLPIDLTLYHTMYVFPTWLNWFILISYLSLVVYFFFKDKRFFFALSFIFVAVFPSITPVKVSWLVAERYMFLGSLGFCIFLALILEDLHNRFKLIMPIVVVVILVGYSVRTYLRNIDWQTNHNLWVSTCQVSPNSHNAWNNIGDDYDKLKQYDNAVKGFTQSTIVKPNYADAFHNRANIFYKIGRLDLARDSYEIALAYSPGLYQTYLSLINIDLTEKKTDLALMHAQKSLQLQPNDPGANYVLAVVYIQRNEIDRAKPILEGILKAYPNFKPAADALAQLKAAIIK